MRIRPDVEVANISDVGCERSGNEDYFLYYEPDDDLEFERRGRLVVIADGMGGRNGGEVASRLAAEVIRDVYLQAESDGSGPIDPRMVLIHGFQQAHFAILSMASDDFQLRGMGTTCCGAILRDGLMYYAHIGDSRIYLIRDGVAIPLTEDHSLVARMVRDGLITEEQAKHHDKRNVLTAALGIDSDAVAGDFPMDPQELIAGDVIAMCTDGLHGLVSNEEIAATIEQQSIRDACKELVALAKVRGGPDNITLQMVKVEQITR
jgi:serine/threonine protein phosphatase PrpC